VKTNILGTLGRPEGVSAQVALFLDFNNGVIRKPEEDAIV